MHFFFFLTHFIFFSKASPLLCVELFVRLALSFSASTAHPKKSHMRQPGAPYDASRGHTSHGSGRYLLSFDTEGHHHRTAQGYPSSSTLIVHSVASLFQLCGSPRDGGVDRAVLVFPGISASTGCRDLQGWAAIWWTKLPFLQEQTKGQTNRLVSENKHSGVTWRGLKRWQGSEYRCPRRLCNWTLVQRLLLLTQQTFKTFVLSGIVLHRERAELQKQALFGRNW